MKLAMSRTFKPSNFKHSTSDFQLQTLSPSPTYPIFTSALDICLLFIILEMTLNFICTLFQVLFAPKGKLFLLLSNNIPRHNKGRRKPEWCFEILMIAFDRVWLLRPVFKLKQKGTSELLLTLLSDYLSYKY